MLELDGTIEALATTEATLTPVPSGAVGPAVEDSALVAFTKVYGAPSVLELEGDADALAVVDTTLMFSLAGAVGPGATDSELVALTIVYGAP